VAPPTETVMTEPDVVVPNFVVRRTATWGVGRRYIRTHILLLELAESSSPRKRWIIVFVLYQVHLGNQIGENSADCDREDRNWWGCTLIAGPLRSLRGGEEVRTELC
jgi:hypothetical protein